jgi:hypothetical protein
MVLPGTPPLRVNIDATIVGNVARFINHVGYSASRLSSGWGVSPDTTVAASLDSLGELMCLTHHAPPACPYAVMLPQAPCQGKVCSYNTPQQTCHSSCGCSKHVALA